MGDPAPSGEAGLYEAIGALRRRLAEFQHAQDGASCQRRGRPACGSGRPGLTRGAVAALSGWFIIPSCKDGAL